MWRPPECGSGSANNGDRSKVLYRSNAGMTGIDCVVKCRGARREGRALQSHKLTANNKTVSLNDWKAARAARQSAGGWGFKRTAPLQMVA